MIRCKMRVNYKGDKYGATIVMMAPVCSDDPDSENKKFWDATPSGSLEFIVTRPESVESLETGKEYYLDIHPCAGDQSDV